MMPSFIKAIEQCSHTKDPIDSLVVHHPIVTYSIACTARAYSEEAHQRLYNKLQQQKGLQTKWSDAREKQNNML
jgi:hypothetical protein